MLSPVVERLREPLPPGELATAARYAIDFCRELYGNARSGDALPLARAVLFQASMANDPVLERRACNVCGLLAADTGDVVEAVEHYVKALRVAGGDRFESSGIWNNIGLAMGIAGNYEMAGRCYQRAIDLVGTGAGPLYVRYAACINLAQSQLETGAHREGLSSAERAKSEETAQLRAADAMGPLRLRRNLVRLLVALGRIPEAEPYVSEAAALGKAIGTPRAAIAAALARSAYELAAGRTDVALTRLEAALTRAREVPAALRDTLASLARAEEEAGNSERALLRLGELSEHVYRSAVERARGHVELATLGGPEWISLDHAREQARARLVSKVAPARQPEGWAVLDRLAVSAAMRIDRTGWHGKRVGALSKALAIASGVDPLRALEIGLAAEVHDIGMLSVPEEILAKKTPLTGAERAIVRRHVDAGAEMLSDDRHPRVFLAREIVRYHHARWDGCGYPERVGGRFIPFAARVCAIADAYDAMVFGLDSCAATPMDRALAELRREAGGQFDPELVATFDRLVRSETEDLGVDLASASGMEGFQELVNALQEDRGFV
ncbi:MAG TPA: HD domain-containing phosphohydrolase [Usitatibacter sp.]|nr:HD domain-containing phosphohydrolase [Usitatibacter sp.]